MEWPTQQLTGSDIAYLEYSMHKISIINHKLIAVQNFMW
jgi:hypothetical protein